MFFRKILFFFLVVLFLQSCDPGKNLIIQAMHTKGVSVIVYANKKIMPFYDGAGNEKIKIEAPDSSGNYKQVLLYGIGNWPNKSIKEFSENTDSIIINNSSGKIRLVNKIEIENYLLKHRSGYAKSILTIKAK